MGKDLNEAKKLVSLAGKIIGITGDMVIDGRLDWGDFLHVTDLIPVVKGLCAIDYSLSAEEFKALTEDEKDELVYYFNDEFKMNLKLGEDVVEHLFAGLLDFYMALKAGMAALGQFKQKLFA